MGDAKGDGSRNADDPASDLLTYLKNLHREIRDRTVVISDRSYDGFSTIFQVAGGMRIRGYTCNVSSDFRGVLIKSN